MSSGEQTLSTLLLAPLRYNFLRIVLSKPLTMDFTLFFTPLSEQIYSAQYASSSFFKSIKIYGEKMPDHTGAQIALIGVPEERGSVENKGCKNGPDEIRKKLYHLKKGFGPYKIVDLGNLKPGIDLEETYLRISEVCRVLLEQNILPILLGGTHDLDFGQYKSYEDMEKLISLLNIDAFLDLEEGKEFSPSRQHIQKLLLYEPNYLLSYTHLAHQTYLIDPYAISILEKLYFEAYRVGQLRSNIAEMEPAIRNADMLSFDITSIKSADAPGNYQAQPFGLTGEEACQICWYAGLNEKLSSVGFYEYNPALDDAHKKTASVIATMIWYFIEGFYHRKKEPDFANNDFLKYVASMPVEPETITFYKSKFTEKWWMEVPHPKSTSKYARQSIVPCSFNDYQSATKGEVPERYISTLAKL